MLCQAKLIEATASHAAIQLQKHLPQTDIALQLSARRSAFLPAIPRGA